MNYSQNLINLLSDLQNADFSNYYGFKRSTETTEDVFEAIFKIHTTETEISTAEKNVIGPLVADLLHIFGIWVYYKTGEMIEPDLELYRFYRSGLELLLDEYKDFPDGSGNTLESALNDFRLTMDIESLDRRYNLLNSSFGSDLYFEPRREIVLTDQEMERVPQSHWWWRD